MLSDSERNRVIAELEQYGLGLTRKTVELVPWRSSWLDACQYWQRRIEAAQTDVRLLLRHVGSTAIEGCPAKPVLDLLVEFEAEAEREKVVGLLEALGFTHRGECGVPQRSYFNFYNSEEDREYVHLHAYRKGHPEIVRLTTFRDFLCGNPEAREKYCLLKKSLQAEGVSRKDYLFGKSSLINELINEAFGNRTAKPWNEQE